MCENACAHCVLLNYKQATKCYVVFIFIWLFPLFMEIASCGHKVANNEHKSTQNAFVHIDVVIIQDLAVWEDTALTYTVL